MLRPEVLAPAGDRAAMEAAVRAGADAVYFGLPSFNARARATNFDLESLESTMRYLHAHGVRGYVTLNTLIFDHELGAARASVEACAQAGVDAVIVQDLGLATMVREISSTLPFHASTQMTCTDADSARFAHELGARRVILARELSLREIEQIRLAAPEVELEVFVHGALCIAYSGQCLTSEAIGGRSANRGACAQACRLPYDLVVDGVLRDLGDKAYLLSPSDLEASSVVPDLMRLGIGSLKIEGRLKGPEYVAATTRLYRATIDAVLAGREPEENARKAQAIQTYSRGSDAGFFPGVDHQRLVDGHTCDHRGTGIGTLAAIEPSKGRTWLVLAPSEQMPVRGDGILVEGGRAGAGEVGGRIWEVEGNSVWLGPEVDVRSARLGARVWKTSDPILAKEIARETSSQPHRVALDIELRGSLGRKPSLLARSERGHVAEVEIDAVLEEARTTPLDLERIREQLGRLGETPFVLRDAAVDLPPNSVLPVSSLNRARRALVEALIPSTHPRHVESSAAIESLPTSRNEATAIGPRLTVLCRNLKQARAALAAGADSIALDFLELSGTGEALRTLRSEGAKHIALTPPRIRKPGEEKIDKFLLALAPDALLVRGLGALRGQSAFGSLERIGDFSLNVANRRSAREVLSYGLAAFTPSFDLDSDQLLQLLDDELANRAEVVIHHPMPLFHMEHCVIAALLSSGRDYKTCGRPCERHQIALRDRAGLEHPVEADVGCRNTVFHQRAQSAAELVPKLIRQGVRRFRVELVRETAEEVNALIEAYRGLLQSRTSARETLRTIRTESSYGVVRGSLRVLS